MSTDRPRNRAAGRPIATVARVSCLGRRVARARGTSAGFTAAGTARLGVRGVCRDARERGQSQRRNHANQSTTIHLRPPVLLPWITVRPARTAPVPRFRGRGGRSRRCADRHPRPRCQSHEFATHDPDRARGRSTWNWAKGEALKQEAFVPEIDRSSRRDLRRGGLLGRRSACGVCLAKISKDRAFTQLERALCRLRRGSGGFLRAARAIAARGSLARHRSRKSTVWPSRKGFVHPWRAASADGSAVPSIPLDDRAGRHVTTRQRCREGNEQESEMAGS